MKHWKLLAGDAKVHGGGERDTLTEQTLGDRVRAIRIERNLSIEGLAAALPGDGHHFSWVSKVEKNRLDLKLTDLYGLADTLRVSAAWLVSGDSTDTEFIARMRGYERAWAGDERAERTVLAVAEQQADEASRRAAAMRRLLADPAIQARYEELLAEEVAIREAADAASEAAAGSERPRRVRGQG